MEECKCCGNEVELEYTCDVCGEYMCKDCTRTEYLSSERYFVCEDCYNNDNWDEFAEENGGEEDE